METGCTPFGVQPGPNYAASFFGDNVQPRTHLTISFIANAEIVVDLKFATSDSKVG
jgi:hypothetical protein